MFCFAPLFRSFKELKALWAQMNYKYCAPPVLHRWNEWANKKVRL